ncbi:hypothetical protein HK102_000905 [Quaeritorhiza haematococci]|nr:hypothetical protein HK102_000905 [Quaeritorhiza haematococci]
MAPVTIHIRNTLTIAASPTTTTAPGVDTEPRTPPPPPRAAVARFKQGLPRVDSRYHEPLSSLADSSEAFEFDQNAREHRKETAPSAATPVATAPSTPRPIHLLDLPQELLCSIAMESGFFGALALMYSCRSLHSLLSDSSSWHDYLRKSWRLRPVNSMSAPVTHTPPPTPSSNHGMHRSGSVGWDEEDMEWVAGPVDVIENEIVVDTKLHTFDHLVFGVWDDGDADGATVVEDDKKKGSARTRRVVEGLEQSQADDSASVRSNTSVTSTGTSRPLSIYFEHKAFSEHMDFIGGVKLRVAQAGLVLDTAFFDHRETLPCYMLDVQRKRAEGLLPPTLPSPNTLTSLAASPVPPGPDDASPASPPSPSSPFEFDPSTSLPRCTITSPSTPSFKIIPPPRINSTFITIPSSNALSPSYSTPSSSITGGVRIDHSCPSCRHYDNRQVSKSIFVFNEVPFHPRWGREGFSWTYNFPDGNRRVTIRVKPFQSSMLSASSSPVHTATGGGSSSNGGEQGTGGLNLMHLQGTLPWVMVNAVKINGRRLTPSQYQLFRRLVGC